VGVCAPARVRACVRACVKFPFPFRCILPSRGGHTATTCASPPEPSHDTCLGTTLTVISGCRAEECVPAGAHPPGAAAAEGDAGWEEAWHNLLLLQALRPDRLLDGARFFISRVLGDRFLKVPDTELSAVLDAAPPWQHTFMLAAAAGVDTHQRVEMLAQSRGVVCCVIALGSPEGYEAADKTLAQASARGGWVLLKNVHLAAEWLHNVEKRLNRMQCHGSFRLFMTMEITAPVPPSLLQSAQLVVYEPPAGLKASLKRTYSTVVAAEERGEQRKGPLECSRLLLLLSWLHGVVLGRLRYCPVGWTRAYEFSETDLRNAADAIHLWLERASEGRSNIAPDRIPWSALRELVALSYGGRIENDFDQLALRSLMQRFFSARIFDLDYKLVAPAADAQVGVPEGSSARVFLEWIDALPDSHGPSWMGLPSDSDTLLLAGRGRVVMDGWSVLIATNLAEDAADGDQGQQLASAATGAGAVEPPSNAPKWARQLATSVEKWLSMLPEAMEAPSYEGDDAVMRCVSREVHTAARLLATVRTDLGQVHASLWRAGPAPAVRSAHLRDISARLRRGHLPDHWRTHHQVPAGIKTEAWLKDLALRVSRLHDLARSIAAPDQRPVRVWLGGLFQPGAFLTATRQRAARARSLSLEKLALEVSIADGDGHQGGAVGGAACEVLVEGCMIHAARWDAAESCLCPGAGEARALPPMMLGWRDTSRDAGGSADDRRERDGAEDASMVELPMYLNAERKVVLSTVRLKGRVEEGAAVTPWHELCSAITLWADP